MMLQCGWCPIEQSQSGSRPTGRTEESVTYMDELFVITLQTQVTYLAWNALLVPRWSRSWHRQPTIRASISASDRTSWKVAVCQSQTVQPHTSCSNQAIRQSQWWEGRTLQSEFTLNSTDASFNLLWSSRTCTATHWRHASSYDTPQFDSSSSQSEASDTKPTRGNIHPCDIHTRVFSLMIRGLTS